jgi:hypothetical protein
MKWVLAVYRLVLSLYPPPFRARFGEEMEEVFLAGLEEARQRGRLAEFLLGEALRLPGSLADVYLWAMRSPGVQQMALPGGGGGVTGGAGDGWGPSLMGGLPHLIIGLLIVVSSLLTEWLAVDTNLLSLLLFGAFFLLGLGVLVYNIRKGWKRWSASWLFYLLMIAIIFLSYVLNLLMKPDQGNWLYEVQTTIIPLVIAYLLYKMACAERVSGLLAALPITGLMWFFFEEFVPEVPKLLATGWMFLVVFSAAVLILRTPRFAAALGLALLVPALSGLPFATLGVYLGGTLPFSQPGPSPQEVLRQYLPFLAMAAAVALGPQMAAVLRRVGQASAKAGGKVYYRLALGGMLLGLLLSMLQFGIASSDQFLWLPRLFSSPWPGLGLALGIYLVGIGLLTGAAMRCDVFEDRRSDLRMAALAGLLPCIPLILVNLFPGLSGHTQQSWVILALEMAWVGGSAWVVAGGFGNPPYFFRIGSKEGSTSPPGLA